MNQLVLAPVFVQIALIFVLGCWLGMTRFQATRSRAVRVKDIALGQNAWPPRATQIGRAYQNQFEMPVVFFALVALALATDMQSTTLVGLEWVFVATRLVHAGIHVTSNNVQYRFSAFIAGVATLAVMWIWFAARIYLGA